LQRRFLPSALVLFHDPADGEANAQLLPQLRGKSGGSRVKTYICTNETCLAPLEGKMAIEKWLEGVTS
jgi:uncharacterized protein YyaL (SSP411 family)